MTKRNHRQLVLLGLGSNVGERIENVRRAIRSIDEWTGSRVVESSSFYETEPRLFHDQPDFVNACAAIETELTPVGLLDSLLQIEQDMGRERRVENGPRLIDLDILYYADAVVDTDALSIPHPDVANRAFVLVPLAEIAPDFIDPRSGKTIEQLREECPDTGWVREITSNVAE